MPEAVVGIDIGGTNSKFGLVDAAGICLQEVSIPTEADDLDKFMANLKDGINELLSIHKNHHIIGIGIGAPNANYYTGTIENAPNLHWGKKVNIVEKMNEIYHVPVVITNDANAAAIGEMKFGAGRGLKDFITITLGTGLGSGIVSNGQLVYGHDGFAGEMGHMVINPNGRDCACGRRGCLETYASATGIRRTVYKMLADHTIDSELRDVAYDDLTGKMITEAALRGDKIAVRSFEYTGQILGSKLADAMAFLSPQAFILMGGLTHAGDLLFNPIKEHLEKNMFSIYKNKVKLLKSGLEGRNPAVLGAAALAFDELEKKGVIASN